MFYLINKEKGISSFKAINKFARERNIKKIGHTGTLDPLATGLLLVATGDDTKFIEFIDQKDKTYNVTFRLGFTSDTYDVEGDVKITNTTWDDNEVINVIKSFKKEYMQMPPSFSAKKINGKRAYKLAREGIEVKLSPKKVRIFDVYDVLKINNEHYSFSLSVSRGTYIRSIVNEIGQELGCGAIMTDLKRIKIGSLITNNDFEEVDIKELVKIPFVEIRDILSLYNGIEYKIDLKDGNYIATYQKKAIGTIIIKENIVIKRKLLGNRIEKILKG